MTEYTSHKSLRERAYDMLWVLTEGKKTEKFLLQWMADGIVKACRFEQNGYNPKRIAEWLVSTYIDEVGRPAYDHD